MATLTDFTRPADPIIEADLEAEILENTGFSVTAIVHPNSIDIIGSAIEGNRANIQTAIDEYAYENPAGDSTKVDKAMISDSFPMTYDSNKIVTENVAKQGDALNKRKAWISGVLKNDSFIYSSKATTNGSGIVTFYITDDGTSSGSAVFTNVYADSISVVVYGSAANYQPSSPTVSGDKKSITVTINQATSVLLGIIQLVNAAASVDCRLYVMGD